MSEVIRKELYVKSDIANNNNKFWEVKILSDGTYVCRWGRVGDEGQVKSFSTGSVACAEKEVEKKIREKTRDGRNGEIAYRKVDIIGNSQNCDIKKPASIDKVELQKIATSQIKNNNPIVEDLIKYLTKVNIHMITTATSGAVTYNDTTGLFSTPLGIITQENIDMANDILCKIGDHVANKSYNETLKKLTNELLMLVPQSIGRNRIDINTFWCNLSKVQEQKSILDGLQASYANVVKNPTSSNEISNVEQIFDVSLNVLENKKAKNFIFDLFNKNKSSKHGCYGLVPKSIWEVEIKRSRDKFKDDGGKMSNIITGWHGTSSANLLSLLKSGFLVTPPSSAYISGKLFGNGIYCAPSHVFGSSTKATNYSAGGWGATKTDRVFVFVVDMAMGKYFTPTKDNYTRISYPMKGYDSTWAKANVSGVINDECIVYRASQVDIKYLIELG